MIIIEGADNLGKTTAALRLAEIMTERTGDSWHRVHHGPPEVSPLIEFGEELDPLGVHDRGHLGWFVWQGALKCPGFPFVCRDMNRTVESLRERRAVVVVLTADPEWYCDRVATSEGRAEMHPDDIRIQANNYFRHLCIMRTESGVPFVNLEYRVAERGFPSDATLAHWAMVWETVQKR